MFMSSLWLKMLLRGGEKRDIKTTMKRKKLKKGENKQHLTRDKNVTVLMKSLMLAHCQSLTKYPQI